MKNIKPIKTIKKNPKKLFNETLMEQISSGRKNDFPKFMKKNNISYDFIFLFKNKENKYNLGLLFKSTLFMMNLYYSNKSPKNTSNLINIIEQDDFNPYYTSIPNVPDFLFTYVAISLFNSISYKSKISINSKSKTNLKIVEHDFIIYLNQYYKGNYNLIYKDIIILAKTLYEFQHPLFNKEKIQMFLADVANTFTLDRGDVKSTRTINIKKDQGHIDRKIFLEIAKLPFIDYSYCTKYVHNILHPLKSIFTNYSYFNIGIILKYSDSIFDSQMLKYSYCYDSIKIFIFYYDNIKTSIHNLVIQKEDRNIAEKLANSIIDCLTLIDPSSLSISDNDQKDIFYFFDSYIEDKLLKQSVKNTIMRFNFYKIMSSGKKSQTLHKSRRI